MKRNTKDRKQNPKTDRDLAPLNDEKLKKTTGGEGGGSGGGGSI
jgi:hypothetical protein